MSDFPIGGGPLGARFVRADLHVHTHPDGDSDPKPDLAAYVAAAIEADVDVLAITDHNTARFAAGAVSAASGTSLLVLPGIEISTHQGHLLGIFAPDAISQLEELALPQNLNLETLSPTEFRSSRSMLDLVADIDQRGGLAIPAHIDADNGIGRMQPAELEALLCSEALAGVEFATKEALDTWFTKEDPEEVRRAAWTKRQAIPAFAGRSLARLMSSDAHSIEKVGQDRTSRTLTRLRLDEPSFAAVSNAIRLSPAGRCKAEATLPAVYPRVTLAEFQGGFLDGMKLEFSPNLNCIIGGRGSGKSTALLAIRAALGAEVSPEDNPDAPGRMPDVTIVHFIDKAGSSRIATRHRDGVAVEAGTNSEIQLRLADLGQDESGRLARGYDEDPGILLQFLDTFVVRHEYLERAEELLGELEENAARVKGSSVAQKQIDDLEAEKLKQEATLKAAESGKVELIAKWAGLLAAQGPFLQRLEGEVAERAKAPASDAAIDIDQIAIQSGLDLSIEPASEFLDGKKGKIREELAAFEAKRAEITQKASVEIAEAAEGTAATLALWKGRQIELEGELEKRQADLEAKGLKVQAGAVRAIADRLNAIKTKLNELKKKQEGHKAARAERQVLLDELHSNWDRQCELRKATLKRISAAANDSPGDLEIGVTFERAGLKDPWVAWLTNAFGFRTPRVQLLAAAISPRDFAEALLAEDSAQLLGLLDLKGEAFFDDMAPLLEKRGWDTIFALQTMALEDRPRLIVREGVSGEPKQFDSLSAGQQRSVLLGLMLCADQPEPLIVDQPEDHLDAKYIADAVVSHLQSAKEQRQVIIATHSPNLTVLGDAELVIPMEVVDGKGRAHDLGAVDRPTTRDMVCDLLEGGVEAFEERGKRYGFRFAGTP